jgi:hypothetical protein
VRNTHGLLRKLIPLAVFLNLMLLYQDEVRGANARKLNASDRIGWFVVQAVYIDISVDSVIEHFRDMVNSVDSFSWLVDWPRREETADLANLEGVLGRNRREKRHFVSPLSKSTICQDRLRTHGGKPQITGVSFRFVSFRFVSFRTWPPGCSCVRS